MTIPIRTHPLHTLLVTSLIATLAACSGNPNTNLMSPTGPSVLGARSFQTTPETIASCSVELQGIPVTVAGGGGTFQMSIAADQDCAWTASHESGIRISPNYGRGATTVTVGVEPNPDRARTLSVSVNGRIAHFAQPNGCTYTIDQKSLTVPASGGRMVIMMTTIPGCMWFASASERWIDVKEARAESSGEAPFEFDANTGGERHASIRIVNEIVQVTQTGATR